MPNPRPFVSVIVPVYNGERHLPGLIQALHGQDYPSDRWEVILVDNASTDRTPLIIGERLSSTVRTVHESRKSSYAARNTGARAASGDIFAFTDVDCRPDSRWLNTGVVGLEERCLDLLSGSVITEAGSRENLFQMADRLMYLRQAWYEKEGFGATANLFVRRTVFEKLGGFDGRMVSSGDRVFCLRARQAGNTLGYCEVSKVRHEAWRSFISVVAKEVRLGRGFAQVARFHEPLLGWLLLGQTYLPLRGVRNLVGGVAHRSSGGRSFAALCLYLPVA